MVGKYLKRIQHQQLGRPLPSRCAVLCAQQRHPQKLPRSAVPGQERLRAIEGQRKDAFFARALGLRAVPSSPAPPTRWTRMLCRGLTLADRINAAVLGLKIGSKHVDFGVLPCGYMPLDVDTFAMDNSGTAQRACGAHLCRCRWLLPLGGLPGHPRVLSGTALRPGTQHSASETEYNIERVLPLAAKLTQSAGSDTGAGGGARCLVLQPLWVPLVRAHLCCFAPTRALIRPS